MDKYVCAICGYVYDPEVGDPDNGVEPGTAWEATSKLNNRLQLSKHNSKK